MPWCRIKCDIDLGEIKLLRYQRQGMPFGADKEKQETCDKVMSNYCISKDKPISAAVIVQLKDKEIFADLTDDERSDVFSLCSLITFSTLSMRQYFSFGDTYWNSSNSNVVIQSFKESPEPYFAINTRRRDGYRMNVFDTSEYMTYRPHYADNGVINVDIPLVDALFKARQSNKEGWLCYEEGIDNFNRANTDNTDIMLHHEIIMIASAFQRICDSSYKEDDLVDKLSPLFNPDIGGRINDLSGYSLTTKSGNTIHCKSAFEFWIRDLYRVRNGCAHGKRNDAYQPIWSMQEHLLFVSYVYPLIVKYKLSIEGYYMLSEKDVMDINVFETLLDYDNVFESITEKNENVKYPWNEIRSKFRLKWIIIQAVRQQGEQNTSNSL